MLHMPRRCVRYWKLTPLRFSVRATLQLEDQRKMSEISMTFLEVTTKKVEDYEEDI